MWDVIFTHNHKQTRPKTHPHTYANIIFASITRVTSDSECAQTTTSMRILMRITNSFFAKQPISATNGDYTTTVRSSDLSDVRFILMDANYHVIKLLSPMYLTVEIEAIPDKLDYERDLAQGPVNPLELIPMSEYAYMHDLTERGQDVADEEIPAKIFIQPPPLPQ